MSKPPPNTPSIGDRVKLRGREACGVLTWMNERKWADVSWEYPWTGPGTVHLHELEKI